MFTYACAHLCVYVRYIYAQHVVHMNHYLFVNQDHSSSLFLFCSFSVVVLLFFCLCRCNELNVAIIVFLYLK